MLRLEEEPKVACKGRIRTDSREVIEQAGARWGTAHETVIGMTTAGYGAVFNRLRFPTQLVFMVLSGYSPIAQASVFHPRKHSASSLFNFSVLQVALTASITVFSFLSQ